MSRFVAPTQRKQCGTITGYRYHLNAGEFACDPCLRASADSTSAHNIRHGRRYDRKVSIATLRLLLTDPEAGRARLLAETGPRTLAAILATGTETA